MSGCLLQDSGAAQCFGKGCERCGWNREEHRRREILLKCEGLTRCADGLKRLIVGEKLEPAPMAEGLKATPGRTLKTCPNCGGMFAGKANQVYCCETCQIQWNKLVQNGKRRKEHHRVCPCCGRTFETTKAYQTYCSDGCRVKVSLERQKARRQQRRKQKEDSPV